MKTKMGRPKLKRGCARTVQCGLRLNPDEFKKISAAIRRDGFSSRQASEWMRFVLLDYVRATTQPVPAHTFKVVKGVKPAKGAVGFGATRIQYIARPQT